LMVPGLDRDRGRRGTGVSGRAIASLGFGVGGHSGLLWSNIGLEISRLSMEGVREEREERDELAIFPLIESVSLEIEKERLDRVAGVLSSERGGVTSPIGMRWSPSLTDRFNLNTASSPSMALWCYCGMLVFWRQIALTVLL